ncbi:MAG: tRNA preQ1(34) S-adenosylmethionine ribosyltransferase-isomerase QueA [Clostridia bacterium]|nr:tRNA preQ1(34) S-adenosylmethionine ribosyltransferase-isomerase QueA [Clostridia bacterium]
MKTSDFYYDLPKEFIAQTPIEPRDHAKLLVYDRANKQIQHRHFYDLPDYLQPGDCLVINETRVLPARLYGVREDTGSFIEFLLLKRLEADMWEILARPGKKARVGQRFVFGEELTAEVVSVKDDGNRVVKFFYEGVFEELLDRLGTMPLPPYITEKLQNQERYQTVYSKQPGSAAAPTAGLHFTPELLEKIRQKGVKVVPVLLHVGLGTFRPVKVDDVAKHQMHSEFYSVSLEAAETINACRQNGGKVFCVGTTSCRTLESVTDEQGVVHAQSGETDIFIYPGYRFKAVDHLITNFHLPESTLLMLVSALCSREEILDIYKTAKKEQYRFFSFGDAMLILGRRNDE